MDEKKKLLKLYHEGKLGEGDQVQLEQYIASGKIELEELNNFSEMMDLMETSNEMPSQITMDSRFYAFLENQKTNQEFFWNLSSWLLKPWRLALPLAMGLLIFWGGIQFGSTEEIVEITKNPQVPQSPMISLLTTSDVSEKIHLVSSTKIKDETDEKIITALLFTLSHDESTNVRLACIETLMDYSYFPVVRAGLVSAISHQNSPLVLENLAEAIEASGKKMNKEEFESHIKKDLPSQLLNSLKI